MGYGVSAFRWFDRFSVECAHAAELHEKKFNEIKATFLKAGGL